MPVTPFIGRAAERAALAAALAEHRLVTATGPGGIGKTRLAISVAAELAPARRDGAWFVDLVHVTDPAMVIAAVAETVGVPEQRAASIDVALVASLADRDGLLVLDNCEHLLDGVRDCVERILDGCPDVTVLATSRTRLLVPYERVYAVPGLSVTDDGGDAVGLFAARVAAATGDRERLGRRAAWPRCAARWTAWRWRSSWPRPGTRRSASTGSRPVSTSGCGSSPPAPRVADRHRSLRDAIGWSYDLLAPDDQALLRGVAVFASWFDVDAAHAVAGPRRERAAVADGLARLADHSLLVVERGEPTRYRALETIRQYGVERLDAGRRARRRPGSPRAVVPRRAHCARRRPSPTTPGAPGSTGSSTTSAPRSCGPPATSDTAAQAAQLAADLAGLLFAPRPTDGGAATVRAGRRARAHRRRAS